MKHLLVPLFASLSVLSAGKALAHHGVAGVGSATLEGPGAPIESASSAVLPRGATLAYAKLDRARYRAVDPTDTETERSDYWMLGLGHGVTSWFSAYLFLPHHAKIDTPEPAGAATAAHSTRGWADYSLMGQIGFAYEQGRGLRLTPANPSLDDLEDWQFSVFAGVTVPHGNPDLRDRNGAIDPGKSTGFGKPTHTLGFTASKQLGPDLTANVEVSALRFREHRYGDGSTMRFGSEDRVNAALSYRLMGDAGRRMRVDGVLELQHLRLGHDRPNGADDLDSGGRILYLMPGLRVFKDNMSFAIGLKRPVSARLSEATAPQQGAEGKEKYRLILSASYLF